MTLKEIVQDIDKKEWLYLTFVVMIVLLVTSLPYLYGYLATPPNFHYLSISFINRVDYPNYFSYIEQSREGRLLFEDLYTTEPQPRVILNLFFLALGLIAKFLRLPAHLIFQLARLFFIIIFLIIIYLFISFVFREKSKRKICLLFICFSSGMGLWFLPLTQKSYPNPIQQPMDLRIPEAITFPTLYTNALFICSLTMIVSIFFLLLLAYENKKWQYALIAGLIGLLLFQIHPYNIPTIFFVLTCFWLCLYLKEKRFSWRFSKYFCLFAILSSPSLFYYWWLLNYHGLTYQRIAQAIPIGFTAPLLSLLITYGLLTPLVFAGIYLIWKKKNLNNISLFLIVWLFSQIVLIYSPLPIPRRMIEGLHIVVSILATFGLSVFCLLLNKMPRQLKIFLDLKNKILRLIIFVCLLALSNVFYLSRDIGFATSPMMHISQDKLNAMKWLRGNTSKNAIILSYPGPSNGNLIPFFALRKVYVGHSCETTSFGEKLQRTLIFLKTNLNDGYKRSFLKKEKINYIFFGEEERYLGGFRPEEKNYLKEVYRNKEVQIFEFVNL